MSTKNLSKINKLLTMVPSGAVLLTSWLVNQGYSLELIKRYRKSHWFESIGVGALKRFQEPINYQGALYALQTQAGLSIHVGAKSALALLGKAHYLELNQQKVILFGGEMEKLPRWFLQYDWQVNIEYHPSAFLPATLALTEYETKNFSINISSPIRALLECLYLAVNAEEIIECYELMESMNNLNPALVQECLENCNSIKVKRLFLFLAEKADHEWVKHLKTDRISLGIGNRSLVPNGKYISKYKITVPKELSDGK